MSASAAQDDHIGSQYDDYAHMPTRQEELA